MRVLGLDPGLTCAGFGVVESTRTGLKALDHGTIRTTGSEVAPRLATLHGEIEALLTRHRPDAVAVERVLFNSNVRTAMSVGQAAGVALLAAYRAGCEIAEYTPSEMKLAVTGYGSADKRQVQQMVARLLGLPAPPRPPDAADALGLAIVHLQARRMRTLQREAADA
ncbi:MAG TPA: crossover junction endodeoxyribonuclease RuvC [Actinomycetota bacterium]|nr:crossover junction endodeoxyribonuclease RuvC [Actinomycetota bacterium]